MNNQGNSPYTILSIIAGVLTTLGAILFPLCEKVSGAALIVLIAGALAFVTIGVVMLAICAYKLFRPSSVPPTFEEIKDQLKITEKEVEAIQDEVEEAKQEAELASQKADEAVEAVVENSSSK